MSRLIIFCLLTIFLSSVASAQEKYWIYFNSKTGVKSEIQDSVVAQRNLPIYTPYLEELEKMAVIPEVKSKWLNAITSIVTEEQIVFLNQLDYVKEIKPARKIASTHKAADTEEAIAKYTTVLKQVKAEVLIENGLNGEGVDIGIIDGGFLDANTDRDLDDIFYEDQFKLYRDFTGEYPDPFGGLEIHNDDHGTRVWRTIGGFNRDKDQYYGIATYSNYYLAKSDRGDREFRGEEDFWIAALEWMDSLGIKIINSSLGYSTGFDDPTENYDPLDINGKSAPITVAAQIAAEEKGILLVVSAGNDGNSEFQNLSVPADAKDVLTVGSCTTTSPKKMGFSSIGSPMLNYSKPDVCCYSLGGTSFSAPVITGIAAAIKQNSPELTNYEIMEIIKKSSHFYPYANNYIGYGVPDSEKILRLLDDPDADVWDAEEIKVVGDLALFPAGGLKKVTVYHKRNEYLVLEEGEVKAEEDEFIIAQPAGVRRSTLVINGKVWEIYWE